MEKNKSGLTSDILRLSATMFVFLLHGRSYIPNIHLMPAPFNWISHFPAWAGVWIFLFLSGYGIGYGFFTGRYRLIEKNALCSVKNFVKFYIGRFMKIAPMYYLYCVIYEVFTGNAYFWNHKDQLLKIVTFTFNGNGGASGIGHLWYLSLAMQLYLFMPFLYLLVSLFKKKKALMMASFVIVIIAGIGMRLAVVESGMDWYTECYTNVFTNIDLALAGILIAGIKTNYEIKLNRPTLWKIIGAVLFALLVLYNCRIYHLGTSSYTEIYRCILPSIYACVSGIMILLSGSGKSFSQCSEKNVIVRFVKWFSKNSFAFYILHMIVFRYLKVSLLKYGLFIYGGPRRQYVLFFGIAFVLILLLAVPVSWAGTKYNEWYKKIEKKVFG